MTWQGKFYCIYLYGILFISFNILLLYNSRFAKQTQEGLYGSLPLLLLNNQGKPMRPAFFCAQIIIFVIILITWSGGDTLRKNQETLK